MPHLKLSPLVTGTAWAFMWVVHHGGAARAGRPGVMVPTEPVNVCGNGHDGRLMIENPQSDDELQLDRTVPGVRLVRLHGPRCGVRRGLRLRVE